MQPLLAAFAPGPVSVLGLTDPTGGMGPLILMFVVAYFLLLRPMKKDENQRKDRLASLAKDDEVVLNGGIVGKISSVDPDDPFIMVRVSDKVKLKVLRREVNDKLENVLEKMERDQGTKKDAAPKEAGNKR